MQAHKPEFTPAEKKTKLVKALAAVLTATGLLGLAGCLREQVGSTNQPQAERVPVAPMAVIAPTAEPCAVGEQLILRQPRLEDLPITVSPAPPSKR